MNVYMYVSPCHTLIFYHWWRTQLSSEMRLRRDQGNSTNWLHRIMKDSMKPESLPDFRREVFPLAASLSTYQHRTKIPVTTTQTYNTI